ncbi:MAG: ATP-dependent sacrificial sulfur transferase LarE [Pirellulales bacterium]|nr:ATP-dependent sacrificial sulfur transferase LarE [Pirellulales bacterium]
MDDNLITKRDAVLAKIESLGSCIVAMSAGVDSSVVAKAAQVALGDRATAVTALSPSLARGELETAQEVAATIGIRHVTLSTDEINDAAYRANGPDRCYHCKTELYERLAAYADQHGIAAILNGTNADDASDYRPGIQAAIEHRVHSPLAECDMNKAEIRALAEAWDLPVWDKPASPCLSSRIAYGEEVTPERLRMIDDAERLLRSHGIEPVRVRYHRGDVARIEVPSESLARFVTLTQEQRIVEEIKAMGFKFVSLDLEGFRSGSLNQLITLM